MACGCCEQECDGDLCPGCKAESDQMDKLIECGHTYHCASRMIYGDGECECELKGILPPEGSPSRKILKALGREY